MLFLAKVVAYEGVNPERVRQIDEAVGQYLPPVYVSGEATKQFLFYLFIGFLLMCIISDRRN